MRFGAFVRFCAFVFFGAFVRFDDFVGAVLGSPLGWRYRLASSLLSETLTYGTASTPVDTVIQTLGLSAIIIKIIPQLPYAIKN